MLEILIGIFILALVAGFGMVLWQLRRNKPESNVEHLTFLNQNIHGLSERMDQTTSSLNQRLDNASQVISAVNRELGQLQEVGRGMRELQDFLRSPKLRGNIGEQVLHDLLEQYFPREHFTMQYKFHDGQAVDAVIKTEQGLIPIDSKFPMDTMQRMLRSESEDESENLKRQFYREVRKHITDISKKYILPQEGTVDFAIMYVPSEAVYYEMICVENDVTSFAQEHHVIAVSPNSFYFLLKVILMGMQGKKIEAATQRILETLSALQKETQNFGGELGVLNTHLSNARGALDRVNQEYTKLSGTISHLHLLK